MKNLDRLTLAEMDEFLSGNQAIEFDLTSEQAYELIQKVLNATSIAS